MVLISRKVDYAILALHALMESREGASAREIADAYGLSRSFIANILKQLCQEGFVESYRGVHGGYRLARPPETISLGEIISALDGPFRLVNCTAREGDGGCGLVEICPIRGPLRAVHDRLLETLRHVTLADLQPNDSPLVELQMEKKLDACIASLPG